MQTLGFTRDSDNSIVSNLRVSDAELSLPSFRRCDSLSGRDVVLSGALQIVADHLQCSNRKRPMAWEGQPRIHLIYCNLFHEMRQQQRKCNKIMFFCARKLRFGTFSRFKENLDGFLCKLCGVTTCTFIKTR